MTVPAPERVEKSTAAVQALLRQLLEMYDAKTLANQLVAHGESHWSPAILKRLLISDRAGHRLSDGEFRYLQNLLPRPPAAHPDYAFRFIDLFAGIGGIRHGFEAIGGQCVFTSEWNKHAVRTYKANWYCDPHEHHFNADIRDEGNIEWGLAYHPYPHPMTEPEFWDDDQTGAVNNTEDSPVVNFKNLNVLTDYFQKDIMRDAGGNVRHIILSEEGFTSKSATRGDVYDIQAAAFAYAYYLVDNNPYIDAFILNRQVDAVIEVEQSCSFGLWTVDMSSPDRVIAVMPKNIYNVFKYIDTNKSLKYTEFAKKIIGINKWSDVIPGFKLQE